MVCIIKSNQRWLILFLLWIYTTEEKYREEKKIVAFGKYNEVHISVSLWFAVCGYIIIRSFESEKSCKGF